MGEKNGPKGHAKTAHNKCKKYYKKKLFKMLKLLIISESVTVATCLQDAVKIAKRQFGLAWLVDNLF